MSRDNSFELTARCGSKLLDNKQFIPAFQHEINDQWEFDPFETSWSWYDCGKHLRAVAKQFPDVLFQIIETDEEAEPSCVHYALGDQYWCADVWFVPTFEEVLGGYMSRKLEVDRSCM